MIWRIICLLFAVDSEARCSSCLQRTRSGGTCKFSITKVVLKKLESDIDCGTVQSTFRYLEPIRRDSRVTTHECYKRTDTGRRTSKCCTSLRCAAKMSSKFLPNISHKFTWNIVKKFRCDRIYGRRYILIIYLIYITVLPKELKNILYYIFLFLSSLVLPVSVSYLADVTYSTRCLVTSIIKAYVTSRCFVYALRLIYTYLVTSWIAEDEKC